MNYWKNLICYKKLINISKINLFFEFEKKVNQLKKELTKKMISLLIFERNFFYKKIKMQQIFCFKLFFVLFYVFFFRKIELRIKIKNNN